MVWKKFYIVLQYEAKTYLVTWGARPDTLQHWTKLPVPQALPKGEVVDVNLPTDFICPIAIYCGAAATKFSTVGYA